MTPSFYFRKIIIIEPNVFFFISDFMQSSRRKELGNARSAGEREGLADAHLLSVKKIYIGLIRQTFGGILCNLDFFLRFLCEKRAEN